jgi:hypothetical protein
MNLNEWKHSFQDLKVKELAMQLFEGRVFQAGESWASRPV